MSALSSSAGEASSAYAGPASSKTTLRAEFSLNRAARTAPADPPPTITTSAALSVAAIRRLLRLGHEHDQGHGLTHIQFDMGLRPSQTARRKPFASVPTAVRNGI